MYAGHTILVDESIETPRKKGNIILSHMNR